MKTIALFAALVGLVALSAPAAAGPVLTFSGSSNQGSTNIAINEFYNGGTDSGGTSGPNYGVSFTNANFDSASAPNGLYNITSPIAYMPVTPLIFSTTFNFSSLSFDQFFFGGGNVLTIYDGVNGTGNILYSGTFGQNCTPNCTTQTNVITFAGNGRSGTLAPNQNGTGIDNLAFNAVPEVSTWAMMLLGAGLIGYGLRSRRKVMVTCA